MSTNPQHTISLLKPVLCLVCALTSFYTAKADVVGDFTRSLSNVWVSAELCRDTYPAAQDAYGRPVVEYLGKLYKNDIPYWVLPPVKEPFTSENKCFVLLDNRLVEYHYASARYRNYYEDPQHPPPSLPPLPRNATPRPGDDAPWLYVVPTARPK